MSSGTNSSEYGDTINVTLKVWRQAGMGDTGRFEVYQQTISTNASFLEMLDQLNEQLNDAGVDIVQPFLNSTTEF